MRVYEFAAIEDDLGLVDDDRTEDMRPSAEKRKAGDRPAKNEVTGHITTTPQQEVL